MYEVKEVIGKTFQSKHYGEFAVIRREKPNLTNRYGKYLVRFKNTGTEVQTAKQYIINGQIKDPNALDKNVGRKILSNSFGEFTVVGTAYDPKRMSIDYVIEFTKTKFTRIVQRSILKSKEARDPYYPIRYGVAYMGSGKKNNPLYSRWVCMISRCYNPKDVAYARYGGAGITTSEEWKCFENFIKEAPSIPGWDESKLKDNKYQLDKDKRGGKIYSVSNCEWMSAKENGMYRTFKKERAE